MENKLNVSIDIEGTSILHFSSFSLEQKFNEHHKFELRFNYDLVEIPGTLSLQSSKDFIGKNITVGFGREGGQEQVFVGKVTRVQLSQTHGYNGDLIVSGFSPTILLDRGPDLGSYLAKDLKTIVQSASKEVASNDLKFKIAPARTDPIDYIIQYRESDFEFINRLSAEYYEWFFYDGSNLNFGKPDRLPQVSLIYGRNLQNLQYALQVAPLQYTKFAYNPLQNVLLTSEGQGNATGTADMAHAIASSNEVFSKSYNHPLPIRVSSSTDISSYVQTEQKALVSDLVRVTGSGDEPTVALGCVVDISVSTRELLDFTVQDFGKFLVVSVFHHIDGLNHYYNTFEAVAADTERLPVATASKPLPDIQIATVVDNNDPEKQSRIKVKFKWQTNNNDPTEWLRILTTSAGNDDQGGSNRGFITIPEKNDQVLIAFEEGNIARPVVIGSIYHNNNGNSNNQQDNNIKSLSTRSGHLIQFNDSIDGQGITITDRNGNQLVIDSQGNNMTITALETMTLNAKNMTINVGQDMQVNVQQDMTSMIQGNFTTMVTQNANQSVGQDFTLIANNIIEEAIEDMTINASSISKTANNDIQVSSQNGNIMHSASQQIQNKSGGIGKLF